MALKRGATEKKLKLLLWESRATIPAVRPETVDPYQAQTIAFAQRRLRALLVHSLPLADAFPEFPISKARK
jgi:hypothetical protein